MANDKNSSKVSEDKDNSPEEAEESKDVSSDDDKVESAESPEDGGVDTLEGDASDSSDVEDNGDVIEDAEVIAEHSELLDALNEAPDEKPAEDVVSTPSAPVAPVEKGPSTFGLVFGGLVAGAIGFLVATFAVPEGWPNPPADPNGAIEATLESQAGQIEALAARIAELDGATGDVDLSPVQDGIAGLSDRIDALSGDLAAAVARVEALENAPPAEVVTAPLPNMDFDAEMETFRAEIEAAAAAARAEVEAAQARASEIEAQAQAAAEKAMQRAALAEVSAALESGAPFSDAMAVLPEAPDALTSVASEGAPTLPALQAAFPDAARNVLQGMQDVPADASAADRFAAFLRKQTNARSLSPREGDDPDAVLSRAEAALSDGDLETALAELTALPDGAQDALGGWVSQARTRVAAMSALQSLSNELN